MQYYGFFFCVSVLFLFCNNQSKTNEVTKPLQNIVEYKTPDPLPKYPWLDNYQIAHSLAHQIAPPKSAKRTKLSAGSFGEWLRYLPLKKQGTAVMLHDGRKKFWNVHHRVIDIDTGKRDLQQCADAVMRLKSEFHLSKKETEQIAFNFTNGTRVKYSDWQKGRKPIVKGNKVSFSHGNGAVDRSYKGFRKYMNMIFSYAGTASLSKEMKQIKLDQMQIGDVFIQGGFPGHAVIVTDMAIDQDGKQYFLLSQSYMPAQDMHVLKNPNNKHLSPWYPLDFEGDLKTPEWTFSKSDLKRF